jgi:tetratricopeptide (TPR) repeat protein
MPRFASDRNTVLMLDPGPLWDFGDPAASGHRFREAARTTEGADRAVLDTQLARALGLQGRYTEAHSVLDAVTDIEPEVVVRVTLERGRLLRSAGEPERSRPYFDAAESAAADAGLDLLQIDALHMVALVCEPNQALAINERALAIARQSSDPRARDWDASLLNNMGMAHADAGDYEAALGMFELALSARQRIAEVAGIRVARWMVAWALRHLGRRTEALAMQRALKADLDADGAVDPYVDEEIAILQRAADPGTTPTDEVDAPY